jgi:hypothetical protein
LWDTNQLALTSHIGFHQAQTAKNARPILLKENARSQVLVRNTSSFIF